MCLILFALDQHPDFPLVMAANRDEFYRRPTAAMKWWDKPEVLAGQDLESGGTWLSVTPSGMVTAVTNVREGSGEIGRHSRGELPLMAQDIPPAALHSYLADNSQLYAGFNLIRLEPGAGSSSGWYYSNRDAHPGRRLFRGGYGLSNHLLQSPWPKLVRLREQLKLTLAQHATEQTDALHNQLLNLLQDNTPAPDHLLPDTGIDKAFERFLSSPFITSDYYGTRASTIVTVSRTGVVEVTEQTWEPEGVAGPRTRFCWQAAEPTAKSGNLFAAGTIR